MFFLLHMKTRWDCCKYNFGNLELVRFSCIKEV